MCSSMFQLFLGVRERREKMTFPGAHQFQIAIRIAAGSTRSVVGKRRTRKYCATSPLKDLSWHLGSTIQKAGEKIELSLKISQAKGKLGFQKTDSTRTSQAKRLRRPSIGER